MNKQEYLLTCIAEECGELQHAIFKMLRFGTEDRHPDGGDTNVENFFKELTDLVAVIDLAEQEGVLPEVQTPEQGIQAKQEKVLEFMEYSEVQGTLTS